MQSPVDRTLDHSLIFALIEIDHADAVAPGLTSSSPAVRRAALLALDQMDHPRISPELVLEQIKSADPSLRSTAASILARHTDWVDAVNR
jgi:HEAT repeat protein